MKKHIVKMLMATALATSIVFWVAGCGNEANYDESVAMNNGASSVEFPLENRYTLKGFIGYPLDVGEDPNDRTIFKRLETETNIHVDWKVVRSEKCLDDSLIKNVNADRLPDFVFSAGLRDCDLLRYADEKKIIHVEEYIDTSMPNLKKIFDKYPQYRVMCTDTEGHIWAFPWIEQLGTEKTSIQTVGNMSFINKKWLDYLGIEVPKTTEEFEKALIAFKDNALELQKVFGIKDSIIPMSCIINDGNQDLSIIINGFGEGIGDTDELRHIAVKDDKKVVCTATQSGYKNGIAWLHKLYEEGLVDQDSFSQNWHEYVSKGKEGRFGVCFGWDISNIDNADDWIPLPALTADTRNITPENCSFTGGFERGRCVITTASQDPSLVCAWIDKMYFPFQSIQNNWGTYGEDDEFDIFEIGTNEAGKKMLKHSPLGKISPIKVRECESVGGPLAVLDEYYGKYVTCPDDAQYRLKWIKDIYTPDMNTKYVYPNVLMNEADSEELAVLQVGIVKHINDKKSEWIKSGFNDSEWNAYVSKLYTLRLDKYIEIYQKYFDKWVEHQ
ncbi:MAG: ABC transporter substrate-binding protein [Lachnospiraceae bacterium]|nr:ABC transporter substrate-binding protein [Lachnospiraceae bacterium]